MKDITELIKFLTDKSSVLGTIMLVALIVFFIFIAGWLVIEPPYVYFVYLVFLAGLAAGVFLLLGAAGAGAAWAQRTVKAKLSAGAEDERALRNLEVIDHKHAEALHWIVHKEGERFSTLVWNIHRELVQHGFLVFDDPATKHSDKTYLRVRNVIWEKVTAPDYQWRWRLRFGSRAPWLERI